MGLELLLGTGLVGVYLINNGLLPSISALDDWYRYRYGQFSFKQLKSPEISQIDMVGQISGNDDEDLALTYLKLGNLIVNDKMDSGDPNKKSETGKRLGVCRQFTEETYGNFLYLVDNDSRGHLKDYVRMASGTVKLRDDVTGFALPRVGHYWMEVRLKGEWFPYDATAVGCLDIPRIRLDRLHDDLPNEKLINFPGARYWRLYSPQETIDGKLKLNVSIGNILLGWHSGIIQMLYSHLKTMPLIRKYGG